MTGHFGPYGGQYVPDTLMAALPEITSGLLRRRGSTEEQKQKVFEGRNGARCSFQHSRV